MASYVDGSLRGYFTDAASEKPAPGGGSVSAFAAALGTAMAQMASRFTVGKPKFAAVEAEVRDILAALEREAEELLNCVDDDVNAYGEVSKAYGMARATDAQKEARTTAIQKALVVAMGPPMRTVRACYAAAKLLGRLAAVCNPMLVSDVGVAAALLKGALMGAKLNVDINLSNLRDAQLKAARGDELRRLVSEASAALDACYREVEGRLAGPAHGG